MSRTRPSMQVDHEIGRLDVLVNRRPRWWSLSSAAAMPMARRKETPYVHGRGRATDRGGSPPGSSSTNIARVSSRTSASGRTAHAPASSSLNPHSWARRSRLAGRGARRRVKQPARGPGRRHRPGARRDRMRVRRPPNNPDGRHPAARRSAKTASVATTRSGHDSTDSASTSATLVLTASPTRCRTIDVKVIIRNDPVHCTPVARDISVVSSD